ncbi:sigma-70 family RNA polymerase sigma factor [Ruthenibacterium sp. CLA-JM-H11]|uniref:Sigma-70 family RNA polymerase sigma factor n=1 Tax=Ruthenibacterium intestinale TaxID=3133163 RepID=A0ABV1GEI3_9FIRM
MPEKDLFIQRAQRYMDDLFRLAFSWLKSRADADDVTQTVLLRLYETDKIFESEEHVRHWLVRVTINECKKYWRSPWWRTEDFTDYANTLVFEQPEASGLFDAVMALGPKYRIVIFLYYYEGYSIEEISQVLKLPRGTVGTRLKRGREQLKQTLSEEVSL